MYRAICIFCVIFLFLRIELYSELKIAWSIDIHILKVTSLYCTGVNHLGNRLHSADVVCSARVPTDANWSAIGTNISHIVQYFSGKLLIFSLILGENANFEPNNYKLAQSDFFFFSGNSSGMHTATYCQSKSMGCREEIIFQ